MDRHNEVPRMAGDLEPGTALAGYRVEAILGRGGMGVVYLAEQERLGRKVAVKLLPPQLAEDERFRERFVRESRLAAALDHPNVVPIYEAGEIDGRLFIAMRYVEGTDLRALLREHGAMAPARAGAIVAQVADALEAAHERGLVHRDVKPANILVARGSGSKGPEHVYLSDFGLTKRAASDSGLTATGQFVGTIDYAAPEQFESGEVQAATDVYSLGCVLYECLAGHPPFPRENDAALMRAHLMDDAPTPSSEAPGIPAALDGVVARAMAKRPHDRFPSAAAFGEAVRDASEVRLLAAPERPAGTRRGWLIGAAAAVVGVIVLVVALLAGRDAPREGGGTTSVVPLEQGSVAEIDPGSGTPTTTIEGLSITGRGSGVRPKMTVGEGGVWVVDELSLTHVDPRTREVEEQIELTFVGFSGAISSVAADFQTVWVTAGSPDATVGVLERVNPATNERLRPVRFPDTGAATGVAVGERTVWESFASGDLIEIDPGTAEEVRRFGIGGSLDAIAVGGGAVWVTDELANTVTRIDERSGAVGEPVSLSGGLDVIAADGSGGWVLDRSVGTVTPVGHGGDIGRPIRVGSFSTDIVAGLGAIWVSDAEGFVYRIDPITKETTSLTLGGPIAALAVDEENETIWVLVA